MAARRKSTRCAVFTLCMLLAVIGAAYAADATETKDWGNVNGYINDAVSGTPIQGATVTIQQDGVFADSGRTVGLTDAEGRYECEAELGRISKKYHILESMISGGLIAILAGGAKEETKRIFVSQLNVRVAKAGYRTYEGVVHKKQLEIGKFAIRMEPVLLTKSDSPEVSAAANGWGLTKIMDAWVEPPITKMLKKVTLKVRLECPGITDPTKIDIKFQDHSYTKLERLKFENRDADGTLIFSGKFNAMGKGSKSYNTYEAVPAAVYLMDSPLGVDLTRSAMYAPYEIADNDVEKKAAQLRIDAFLLCRNGDYAGAAEKLKELCELPKVERRDLRMLIGVYQYLKDYDAAAAVCKRFVDDPPEEKGGGVEREVIRQTGYGWVIPVAMPDFKDLEGNYALALAQSDEKKVLSELAPPIEKMSINDRLKDTSFLVMLAIGESYLKAGQLDKADAACNELMMRPEFNYYPRAVNLRWSIAAKKAETAANVNPNTAQPWADWGHALMELSCWSEAAEKLRTAGKLDPGIPWIEYDLAFSLIRARTAPNDAKQYFDDAIRDAEKEAGIADNKEKPRDFAAWHRIGIQLYRKACLQQSSGDPAAAETLKQSTDILAKALVKAGVATNSNWTFANLLGGPSVSFTSGFAYPIAGCDFIILESLDSLEKHPDDYLAHYNLAAALTDLGHCDLAADALDKCAKLKPDYPGIKWVRAWIARIRGDRKEAESHLCDLLKLNPRHPFANQVLAELYTEDGNTEAAAACRTEHLKYYKGVK